MKIEALDENVIAHLRSSFNITSISQLISELVHNSLDAKSTAIAIRVNLTTFRIQIVDNGNGISRANLEYVGEQYMTNKCNNITNLRQYLKYYGYRGEAIWSIAKLSKAVMISSREKDSDETYTKIIEGEQSRIIPTKYRPSCGTTVTIEKFLINMPVRQKQIKLNELEIIKRNIEGFTLIHPKVSFTLKDDLTGKLYLKNEPYPTILESFINLHPDLDKKEFKILKNHHHRYIIEGLFYKKFHHNNRLQYIFVNKRAANCTQIRNHICQLFKKHYTNNRAERTKKCPVFIVSIKCPYSEIDFNLEPTKTVVLFKRIHIIYNCLDKMLMKFFGKVTENVPKVLEEPVAFRGLSQVFGAIKGCGRKRKLDVVNEEDLIVEDEEDDNVDSLSKYIEQTAEENEKCNKHCIAMKMAALPIEIVRNLKDDSNTAQGMYKNPMDVTVFTNFPENEKKGKNLIMDMFMKSVQVYPQTEKIDEIEMNNVIPETLPVDIIEETAIPNCQKSVGVQTISVEKVSTGIQVTPQNSPSNNHFSSEDIIERTNTEFIFPSKALHHFMPTYNYDFPIIDEPLNFDKTLIDLTNNLEMNLPLYDCDRHSRIFSMPKRNNVVVLDNITLNPICEEASHIIKPPNNVTTLENAKLSPIKKRNVDSHFSSPFFSKPSHNSIQQDENINNFLQKSDNSSQFQYNRSNSSEEDPLKRPKLLNLKSPYFSKNIKSKKFQTQPNVFVKNTGPFHKFATQNYQHRRKTSESSPMQNIFEQRSTNFNESNSSKYFTPKGQKEKEYSSQNDIFEKTVDPFANNDLVDGNIELEGTSGDQIREFGSEFINIDEECEEGVDSEWMKKKNDFGTTVYVNKISGVQTVFTPKQEQKYELIKRVNFLPKGSSPLMKKLPPIDDLSPNTKEKLNNVLVATSDDDLLIVKWQNCIGANKNIKEFFQEMYDEKSKMFEDDIPNVSKTALMKHQLKSLTQMSFTKDLFVHLIIIGQLDCKFIVALHREENILLLFDQHAVDERIRVELLSAGYQNSYTKLPHKVSIFLSSVDLDMLKSQISSINVLGLFFKCFTDGIEVDTIPTCLYNKHRRGANLLELIEKLIKEIIDTLKTDGMLIRSPTVIQDIINSEACRGAIKFGDKLSNNECFNYIQKLSFCTLPFQCAHGRPTITPLIILNKDTNKYKSRKPNLKNLSLT